MTTDISVVRGGWDPTLQQEIVDEYEYDGGNSSSRLFERSRIKALAGTIFVFHFIPRIIFLTIYAINYFKIPLSRFRGNVNFVFLFSANVISISK